jgi:hypothetical protein
VVQLVFDDVLQAAGVQQGPAGSFQGPDET